jgi:protein TonB
MSAKMGIIHVDAIDPIDVVNIPIKPPPEPQPDPKPRPDPKPSPHDTFIDTPPRLLPVEPTNPALPFDLGPTTPPDTLYVGTRTGASLLDPPRHVPVRVAALFETPDSAIRPPYPTSKLREQVEATLKLRLSIDAKGRVISVEPVGAADPAFLVAARRHIIRAWRYKPATEDGVAVPWSTVITLSFRLEEA